MKKAGRILIIFLLLSACGHRKQSTLDFITVDVTKSSFPKKELILQDFMDVEYIALETTDEFITQGSVKAIGRNFILAINHNRTRDGNIFVFDRDGKALRVINHLGQGGEEYSNILDIVLDEDNNEMYVHNHYERKMQVYDLYGKYQRTLRYSEHTDGAFYTDIYNYDKDNLLCYDKLNEKKAFVLLSKQDGSITRKIEIPFKESKILRQINNEDSNDIAFPDYSSSVIPFDGNWLLIEHSSDTVYTFLPDYSLRPFIVRTPSVHSMDPEVFLILRSFSDRYYFMETIENKYDFKRDRGFSKTFFMYDTRENSFWGYTVYNGDYSTKKEIYMSLLKPVNHEIESWQRLEAHQLVESYEKGELKGKLKEIAATLNEEDNPVIMLIKHK